MKRRLKFKLYGKIFYYKFAWHKNISIKEKIEEYFSFMAIQSDAIKFYYRRKTFYRRYMKVRSRLNRK